MMREEGVKKGDKKQVFKYSAESEHSTQLMDNLKERVLQHADKVIWFFCICFRLYDTYLM